MKETEIKKPKSVEAKAIALFNEALSNRLDQGFESDLLRKKRAQADCMILISNIKIALYESTMIDMIPARAYDKTIRYYTQVNLIIQKM